MPVTIIYKQLTTAAAWTDFAISSEDLLSAAINQFADVTITGVHVTVAVRAIGNAHVIVGAYPANVVAPSDWKEAMAFPRARDFGGDSNAIQIMPVELDLSGLITNLNDHSRRARPMSVFAAHNRPPTTPNATIIADVRVTIAYSCTGDGPGVKVA